MAVPHLFHLVGLSSRQMSTPTELRGNAAGKMRLVSLQPQCHRAFSLLLAPQQLNMWAMWPVSGSGNKHKCVCVHTTRTGLPFFQSLDSAPSLSLKEAWQLMARALCVDARGPHLTTALPTSTNPSHDGHSLIHVGESLV